MWVSVKFKILLLCGSLKIGRRQLDSGAAGLVFLVSLDCRNGACGQGSSIHGTRLSLHVMTEPRGALQSSASQPHRGAPGSCGLAFQIPFGRLLLREPMPFQ